MRRHTQPHDNARDNDDGHRGAVETNAGESDGANENWDSPAFEVEAIRQFNANIIVCHMTTRDRGWYIVVYYLAPFDRKIIWYVEAAMVEWTRGEDMLFAGYLNVDLERMGGQGLDKEIAVEVATVGLEEISAHFLPQRRAWN